MRGSRSLSLSLSLRGRGRSNNWGDDGFSKLPEDVLRQLEIYLAKEDIRALATLHPVFLRLALQRRYGNIDLYEDGEQWNATERMITQLPESLAAYYVRHLKLHVAHIHVGPITRSSALLAVTHKLRKKISARMLSTVNMEQAPAPPLEETTTLAFRSFVNLQALSITDPDCTNATHKWLWMTSLSQAWTTIAPQLQTLRLAGRLEMIHQVFALDGTLCTSLSSISVSAQSSNFVRHLDASFGEETIKVIKHFMAAVSGTLSELSLVSQNWAPVDTGSLLVTLLELELPKLVNLHLAVSRRETAGSAEGTSDAASFIQKHAVRLRTLSIRSLTLDQATLTAYVTTMIMTAPLLVALERLEIELPRGPIVDGLLGVVEASTSTDLYTPLFEAISGIQSMRQLAVDGFTTLDLGRYLELALGSSHTLADSEMGSGLRKLEWLHVDLSTLEPATFDMLAEAAPFVKHLELTFILVWEYGIKYTFADSIDPASISFCKFDEEMKPRKYADWGLKTLRIGDKRGGDNWENLQRLVDIVAQSIPSLSYAGVLQADSGGPTWRLDPV